MAASDQTSPGGSISAWGNISTGNVSGTGIAIGHGASAEGSMGLDSASLASLFGAIRTGVENRPEDPAVSKDEVLSHVGWIETAAREGTDESASRIRRWLSTLAGIAPDIAKTVAAALVNPVAGVAAAVQTVAKLFLEPS